MAKEVDPSDLLKAASSGDVEEVRKLLPLSSIDHPEDKSSCDGRGIYVRNTDNKTALYLAVEQDNMVAIQTLVHAGADVNFPIWYHMLTPLMIAANWNRSSCVEKLIQLGADVNRRNMLGMNALMEAASEQKYNCLKILIDAGAEINESVEEFGPIPPMHPGATALMFAARVHHIDCLKLLLEAGADVNKKTSSGETALIWALEIPSRYCDIHPSSVIECVRILIDYGAEVNVYTQFHETALIKAVSMATTWYDNAAECVKILLDNGADVNFQIPGTGETALTWAFRPDSDSCLSDSNVAACVKVLIDYGADVNVKTSKSGTTALMRVAGRAAYNGGFRYQSVAKCIRIIIGSGADVNMQNVDGKTPLMIFAKYACSAKHINVSAVSAYIKLFIELGADVRKSCHKGETALMYAAQDDRLVHLILPILVTAGAAINQQDCTGMSALTYAISSGSYKCVKYLVDSGADVNVQNVDGKTPLLILIKRAHFLDHDNAAAVIACVKLFIKLGADVTKSSYDGKTVLMSYEDDRLVHLFLPVLVKAGAAIDQQDSTGMTALTYAIKRRDYTCVSSLLDSGASVNIREYSGRTPLHYLVSSLGKDQDVEQCLKVFINKQVDVNATDHCGQTPLMYAATTRGSANFMTVLLEHGAEINRVDNQGQTALIHCMTSFLQPCYRLRNSLTNVDLVDLCLFYQIHYCCDMFRNFRFLIEKGADIGIRKLETGSLYSLVTHMNDFDLTKLRIGHTMDLSVSWDSFVSEIRDDKKHVLQCLIINGVMPLQPSEGSRFNSLLQMVVCWRRPGIAKYLIATCFLHRYDLTFSAGSSRHFSNLSRTPEVYTIVANSRSQPWPLVKLCFVAVSTAFGASPGRQERVKNSQLPVKLQRMLLFQEPWSRLCVHQWDKIPLTFSPEEYEKLPRPRPLLYYWPVGRALVPCKCRQCNGTMYTFAVNEEEEDSK